MIIVHIQENKNKVCILAFRLRVKTTLCEKNKTNKHISAELDISNIISKLLPAISSSKIPRKHIVNHRLMI